MYSSPPCLYAYHDQSTLTEFPHLTISELPNAVEVLQRSRHPLAHRLLALPHPDPRIKVLLIRLIRPVRVPDHAAHILLLRQHIVADPLEIRILRVRVDVHFDHPVLDPLSVLLFAAAGPAVEDEEDGLGVFGAGLLLDERLVLLEELGVQLHVAGLIDAVHVAEGGRDREVGADLAERRVDVVDVLGLGVEGVVVDVFVVDAVFFAACDADFLRENKCQGIRGSLHLQRVRYELVGFGGGGGCSYHLKPLLHRRRTLQVLRRLLDIVLLALLAQVDHVA